MLPSVLIILSLFQYQERCIRGFRSPSKSIFARFRVVVILPSFLSNKKDIIKPIEVMGIKQIEGRFYVNHQ